MQKEQHGDCVVSSVPHIGLHSFSKPTFKIKRQEDFLFWWIPVFCRDCKSSFRGSFWAVWKLGCQFVLKTNLLSVFNWRNGKVGCESFETENVHKQKDGTYMMMWNQSSIKSYGTSTGRYALHGKRSKRGKQRQRTGDESAQEMSVDGRDLTICGGLSRLHGFLFWGILCCKFFFFFFFFFTFLHTKKHQDGKHYQRLKERTNTQRYFPKCRFSQSARFFCFDKQLSLNFDIWEGNSPSLVS